MPSASKGRGCRIAACRGIALAAAIVSIGSAARATNYNESVQGDLSNCGSAQTSTCSGPTNIGTLTLGDNYLVGATIPSGEFISPQIGYSIQDNDYATFTVPNGLVLSQLTFVTRSTVVQPGNLAIPATVIQPGDNLFFAIAAGSSTNVTSAGPASSLLGYALVGATTPVGDVTSALVNSKNGVVLSTPGGPVNFPPAGGFTAPLGAGNYTIWLLDGDSPVSYSLDLVTAPAPEPAVWMTMIVGFGAIGTTLRRRQLIGHVAHAL